MRQTVTRRRSTPRLIGLTILLAMVMTLVIPQAAPVRAALVTCPVWPCAEYTISGRIQGVDPVTGITHDLKNVAVFSEGIRGRNNTTLGTARTDEFGRFTIIQASPGAWALRISDQRLASDDRPLYGSVWWGGSPFRDEVVPAVIQNANIDVGTTILPLAGEVHGSLQVQDGSGASDLYPLIHRIDPDNGMLQPSYALPRTSPDGSYSIDGLAPGQYILQFKRLDFSPFAGVGSQYWPDAELIGDAIPISVESGDSIDLGHVDLAPRSVNVDRLTGENRYLTAVAISRLGIPDVPAGGVPVLFIVNGLSFPDALSAGPAASVMGGALLLVNPNVIPAGVGEEIARLDPQRIVVVGGPTMVSASVEATLRTFAPTERWTGSNRYETSALVAKNAFKVPIDVSSAYLSTGEKFPDALSAGSLAGGLDRPILLIPPGALGPASTAIADLGITRLTLLGGPSTIYESLQDSLDWSTSWDAVERITGTNRYETSVALADEFVASDTVFLTTGLNFPDALSVSWLAAKWGAPVILTPGTCVPAGALAFIRNREVRDVIVLGGPTMMTEAAKKLTPC